MTAYLDACDDCGAICVACGRRWCRAETVSPGERDDICLSCFEQDIPADTDERWAS